MKKFNCLVSPFLTITASLLVGAGIAGAQAQEAIPAQRSNRSSDRYEINQTFGGVSFWKDDNIWVYTEDFAGVFGMSKGGIDPQLTGIEAAAFRIENPGYKICGMGGKAEQCMNMDRCMLDVYVDERKHPLPWVNPEQNADWHRRYNSSIFLRTSTEKDGAPIQTTTRFTPNKLASSASSLHPFADPITTKEALFYENSKIDGDGDLAFNSVAIYGYTQKIIGGLTLISLNQGCLSPNVSKQKVIYRLESREEVFSPPLGRFFEFTLSSTFTQRMRDVLNAHSEMNAQYFRNLLTQSKPKQ